MRVHWTARARARLAAICKYIAKDSPQAAAQIELRLLLRSRQMGEFPRAGRMVLDYERDDIRELIEGNYRLIYRIKAEPRLPATRPWCAFTSPGEMIPGTC